MQQLHIQQFYQSWQSQMKTRTRRPQLGGFSAVLKPQVFSFSMKPKKECKSSQFDYLDFSEQITEPNIHQLNWRPKLPTKKLLQQPRFLMSLQRKKVRVITGLKQSELELKQQIPINPRKNRIKIRRETSKSKKVESQNWNQPNNYGYIHNQFFLSTNIQRQNKTPIINFNLQHLIEKRKTFKSQHGSRKKGSNTPYYSYISSERFDRSRRNLDPNMERSQLQSRDNSIETYSPSARTAQIRTTIIQMQ